MFDISDRLLLLTGELEPFRRSGGHVNPDGVAWLCDQLTLVAAEARKQAKAAGLVEKELEGLIEDQFPKRVNGPPGLPVGGPRLRVIEGGRGA